MDIKILHEEEDYLIINKPCGVIVHPSRTTDIKGTVVEGLMNKMDKELIEKFQGEEVDFRPGIVHRLDKDTSGVMIVARTQRGYEYFVDQFKTRKVKKVYLAMVKGKLEHKEGIIDSPIARSFRDRKKMDVASDGKEAVTSYKVVEEFDLGDTAVSLLEVLPKTGRTHQIRVHMKAIGHHIVGDRVYGVDTLNKMVESEFGLKRQFLHAWKISFDGKEYGAEFPADLEAFLRNIRNFDGS